MTKPKFTPGPWKVFHATDGRTILGVGDQRGGGITDTGDISTNDQGLWRSGEEKEANACLIASAPDLYKALKSTRTHVALLAADDMGGVDDLNAETGESTLTLSIRDIVLAQIDAALAKAIGAE